MAGAYRVKKGLVSYVGGERRVLRAGQLVTGDDPLVAHYGPKMFESIDERIARVEQATAAPGEQRRVQASSQQARQAARDAAEPPDDDAGIRHVGGGTFELANGERVRGRDAALARAAELADGGADGD